MEKQSEESQKRIENFVKEYGDLVKKYDVDFIGYPSFLPVTNSAWGINISLQPTDTKNLSKPTPFKLND